MVSIILEEALFSINIINFNYRILHKVISLIIQLKVAHNTVSSVLHVLSIISNTIMVLL